MRKYFTKSRIGNSDPRRLITGNLAEWTLFEAYVRALPDTWRPELRRNILAAIELRNVEFLFEYLTEVTNYQLLYDNDTSVQCVRIDRQIESFLKKFPFSSTISCYDPRSTAISKWRSAEDQCRDTNIRLRSMGNHEFPRAFWAAKELIFNCLGDLSPERIMRILGNGKHGPGSTLSSRGDRTTPYYKYVDFPYTVTEKAAPYALAAISLSPRWLDILESSGRRSRLPPFSATRAQKEIALFWDCVEVKNSDRITFVPKDCRTDRPIAVGASLNMFLQLGVKAELETCLKRVGVDLTNQEKNREFAFAGSKFAFIGEAVNNSQFSTIDLASASDTISFELVKKLLPPKWFAFLCDLRHESGDLAGETIHYEKFSAMGNGFTFPLESLIFWALAKASVQKDGSTCLNSDIAVYGDDIIVRKKYAEEVITTLNWAGFSVNQEKSFISGLFKESCGADYFKGHDVRPFYLKREIKTYEDIYFICNSIAKKCMLQGVCPGLAALYKAAVNFTEPRYRRYLPLGEVSDEAGFQVPLSSMTSLGNRPWLSDEERDYLCRRRLLSSRDMEIYSMFAIETRKQAKPFSGKAWVRLFIALSSKVNGPPHQHAYNEDFLHYDCASSGVVTRRKTFTYVTRVVPVLNWNSCYKPHELYRHPFDA